MDIPLYEISIAERYRFDIMPVYHYVRIVLNCDELMLSLYKTLLEKIFRFSISRY